MRDYGRVTPQFWTGQTGRHIRKAGRDAQVVAMYLMTCPASNMIGLYYLPIPTLCHETGLSEKEAWKALRSLLEAQFCDYDRASEVIWVASMARYQIGEQLDPKDKRCKGVWRELSQYKNTKFFQAFHDRYRVSFCLPDLDGAPLQRSPSEAPFESLRSQDQEQEQEQEQEQKTCAQVVAPPKSGPVWDAYSGEYQKRYGIEPVRNKKTNALLCQLVDRLGTEDAPRVAAFYVHHPKPVYVSNRHPATLLLRDAEGLRTECFTGRISGTMPKTFADSL